MSVFTQEISCDEEAAIKHLESILWDDGVVHRLQCSYDEVSEVTYR